MTRLEFRPQAEKEIDDAAAWYEEQASGLGIDFLKAVDTALDVIVRTPYAFSRIARGTRRYPMRRFPYGIIYQPTAEITLIVSCFHDHRDPARWRNRL
jgi:plasmid stabilization system protein ParE